MREWINIVEARLPRKFRIYRMPRGTTVYHGTSNAFAPHHLDTPCWVSTAFDVAEHFSDWHGNDPDTDEDESEENQGKRIIEFKTNRMLRLLYVEGKHTFDDIGDTYGFSMDDPEEMAEAVCRLGYDGWYIESNYLEGDDTMLSDSSVLSFVKIHSLKE
jgi:hypothetical protein